MTLRFDTGALRCDEVFAAHAYSARLPTTFVAPRAVRTCSDIIDSFVGANYVKTLERRTTLARILKPWPLTHVLEQDCILASKIIIIIIDNFICAQ